MNLQLVTPPTSYALTASELEAHSRATGQPADQLEPYLYAAMDYLEAISNRRFITQAWKLFLDSFPSGGVISLPYSPLASVTHIKYTDILGVQRTLDQSRYGVSVSRIPGQILLEYNQEWPTDTLRYTDPIEIQFVCGWSSAESVPHSIRQAVRMLAAHWYEQREGVAMGTTAAVDEKEVPMGVSAAIAPWRVWL